MAFPDCMFIYETGSCDGRWPACLRITAAVALPVKDSDDLTVVQNLIITAPHAVKSLLRVPLPRQVPERWVSNVLLIPSAKQTFPQPFILNPASMMPRREGELLHYCMDIISSFQNIRPDLIDVWLASWIWKCIPMAAAL